MKLKLFNVLILSVFLVGCGGSDSDNKTDQSTNNLLIIKSDAFEKRLKLPFNEQEYQLSAYGNIPKVTLSISNSDLENSNNSSLGWLELDQHTKEVNFSSLVWSSGYDVSALQCFNNIRCQENSTYSFDESTRKLNIKFSNTPNILIKDYSKFSEQSEAIISGKFEFLIPKNWIAFNKERFPIMKETGSFNINGQDYKLSNFETDMHRYIETVDNIERTYIGSIDVIQLQYNDKSVYLYLNQNIEDSNSFNTPSVRLYISNSNEFDDSFSSEWLDIDSSQVNWGEDGKLLSLNLNKVKFYDKNKNIEKTINSNLVIPRSTANITLNTEKALLEFSGDGYSARVVNDQKIYNVRLESETKTLPFQLIQEFNGNITLEYNDGVNKINCGDRENLCSGLTIDTDKKVFRFDHVRLGDNILNGTIYIAGLVDRN